MFDYARAYHRISRSRSVEVQKRKYLIREHPGLDRRSRWSHQAIAENRSQVEHPYFYPRPIGRPN
ncbi:MAG: hypothetical protein U7126_16940 [Microcoleus sp.]